MKHVDKCDKCGKEYNQDVKNASEGPPKCDACGAALYEPSSQKEFYDENEDEQHMVEKGLRKVTDEFTDDNQ